MEIINTGKFNMKIKFRIKQNINMRFVKNAYIIITFNIFGEKKIKMLKNK